jgi:hypothetical protein
VEDDAWRAREDACRFGRMVWEEWRPGAKVDDEARGPKESIRRGARIVVMGNRFDGTICMTRVRCGRNLKLERFP